MDKFNQLKQLVASIEADADKFYNKGNDAAGKRLRKGLQQAKALAQDIRNDVTSIKHSHQG
jgi:hypothetical protein